MTKGMMLGGRFVSSMENTVSHMNKEQYQRALAENLPLLRSRLSLSQTEVADMVGTSRQTISLIERGSREMMWDTCMSLTLLFVSNPETRSLMPPLGIDIDAMADYLNISSHREKKQSESGDELL